MKEQVMTPTSDWPNVSVVIPCYNREASVRAAVESVLEQDYPCFEVVLVDDCSTDDTLNILNSIDDPRVKVVTSKVNNGPGVARNRGVSESSGEWVAFQDSDDLWLPGKLRRQMEVVRSSNDAVAVYCRMSVRTGLDGQASQISHIPSYEAENLSGDVLRGLVYSSFISTQTLVIRRDVFDSVGGFDVTLPALEDWELMLRVAQWGPVEFVEEPLVEQAFSDNSLTKNVAKRLVAQSMILEKHTDLIGRYQGALAYSHVRLAGAYRRQGDYVHARKHAFLAAKKDKKPKSLIVAIYTAIRSVFSGGDRQVF